jgi:predicted acyltransferase
MLLVNNAALDTFTPEQLTHAEWGKGIHVADLVFPWFLLCVGVAIPFSAASFARRKLPAWAFDLRIVFRAAALVALGCLVDSSVTHRLSFNLGVLQMIGLAYLLGALLYDLHLIRRLAIAFGLLVAFGFAVRYIPIPGVGTVFTEENNLIRYFNRTYLMPFGLSGLLGAIPMTAMVLFGTAIGDLFRSCLSVRARVSWLAGAGLCLSVLGFLANVQLPFNKPYWTPSYILLCAGIGCLTLLAFYALTDLQGWTKWPYVLLVFGSNAIVAYVVPIAFKGFVMTQWHPNGGPDAQQQLYEWLYQTFGRIPGGWVYTIGYVVVVWIFLWVLYWRKWFVRV